jgi:hypothetical protein
MTKTNRSRKHISKHDKPHKCDEPNCARGIRGFTTPNDLARHKKSIHQNGFDPTGKSKSFTCMAPECRSKSKIWPRFDNFKHHVEKMHPMEDRDTIIERYEWHVKA